MVNPVKVIFRSARGFVEDRGAIFAAALAYFFILDIVPLCLFGVGVIGFILGYDYEILQFVLERMMSFFPTVTDSITAEIERIGPNPLRLNESDHTSKKHIEAKEEGI